MNDAISGAPLRVASHVRLCACDGSIIVLDLRRSRYWNVSASTAKALASMVHGWPGEDPPCVAPSAHDDLAASGDLSWTHPPNAPAGSSRLAAAGTSALEEETHRAQSAQSNRSAPETHGTKEVEEAQDLTRRLLALGILTRSRSEPSSRLPVPPALEPASESLNPLNPLNPVNALSLDMQSPRDPRSQGRHVPRMDACRLFYFLRSGAIAAWSLRVCSLHEIALRLAIRRERLTEARDDSFPGCRDPGGVDVSEAMRSAALSFDRLRPLAFSARDRCLHDSLSLMEFLAAEGLCPRWVVGVKTGPFGAHSWVQAGATVLNDQHERVRAYRPILVI